MFREKYVLHLKIIYNIPNLQNYNDKILFNKNIYLIHCKSSCKKITIYYHSKTRGTNSAKTKKRHNQKRLYRYNKSLTTLFSLVQCAQLLKH